MQYFDTLQSSKYLTYQEIEAIVKRMSEVFSQRSGRSRSYINLNEKALLSWYMREYLYLPFSAISKSLGWAKSANCRESVVRTNKRISDSRTPMIFDECKGELFRCMMEVCNEEYDCGYGPALSDMVMLEDSEHALYLAAISCGFQDRRSSPGCSATPKNSQLLLFDEMLSRIIGEHSSEDVYTLVELYRISTQ